MKITDCGFNNSNILFAVIDGVLILANKDTAEMYKVNVVSKFKPAKIKGVKTIKIETPKPIVKEYDRNAR